MTDTGLVQNVTQQALGSELADPAPQNATVLTIHDAADFAEGDMVRVGPAFTITPPNTAAETTLEASTIDGMIRVGGDAPDAELVHYLYVVEPDEDDDEDEDAAIGLSDTWAGIGGGWGGAEEWDTAAADWNARADDPDDIGPATITLNPATPITRAGGWPAGTRVDVWDPVRDEPATEWRAQIRPDSQTANTDAIDAAVAFSLIPLLPEGTRTEHQAELVVIDDSTGDWRVVDVPGRYPQVGGGFAAMQDFLGQQTTTIATNTLTGPLPGWTQQPPATNTIGSNSQGVFTINTGLTDALVLVIYTVAWASGAQSNRRAVIVYVNGAEVNRNEIANVNTGLVQQVTYVARVSGGDTIDMRVWQNSGADVNLNPALTAGHRMQYTRIG